MKEEIKVDTITKNDKSMISIVMGSNYPNKNDDLPKEISTIHDFAELSSPLSSIFNQIQLKTYN